MRRGRIDCKGINKNPKQTLNASDGGEDNGNQPVAAYPVRDLSAKRLLTHCSKLTAHSSKFTQPQQQ